MLGGFHHAFIQILKHVFRMLLNNYFYVVFEILLHIGYIVLGVLLQQLQASLDMALQSRILIVVFVIIRIKVLVAICSYQR